MKLFALIYTMVDIELVQEPGFLLRFAAQKEIARNAHQRHQRQILIDRGYPLIERVLWRFEPRMRAAHQNLAFVWVMNPREHFDEGGFASSIVSEKAMHFARAHIEGHIL